jgi:hypothetical protein
MLSTLLQTIQSENCKLTAVLEDNLISESNKLAAETAKQIAALEVNINSKLTSATEKLKSELRNEKEKLAENIIAGCESANAAVREEFNAKLNSEVKVVAYKIDDVSREVNNKSTTLTNDIESVRENN